MTQAIEHKISDTFSIKIEPKSEMDCDVTLINEGQKDLKFPFVAEVLAALSDKFGKQFTQDIILLVAMTMGNLKEMEEKYDINKTK